MRKIITTFILALIYASLFLKSAEALTIDWAGTISNTNAFFAEEVLDSPDGVHAMFGWNTGIPRYGTISDFGLNESIGYDINSLGALLGVNQAILSAADFFTIEYNGDPASQYESGNWLFSDNINSFSFSHDISNPGNAAPIIAYGIVSNSAYANYFGFENQMGNVGAWPFLLIDVDGFSNVNPFSNNFSVTLTATDSGAGTDPDPDVMGRIYHSIPEPATLSLLGFGLLGLIFRKKHI